MLKYFVMTVEALISAAVIVGAVRGLAAVSSQRMGRLTSGIGAAVGLLGAFIMAYLKNATKLIDTSMWNLCIFGIFTGLAVILLILAPINKKPVSAAAAVVCGLLAGVMIFYALPDVAAYPYSILVTDRSVLSTGYLFKLIGALLGVIAVVLTEMAVRMGTIRLGRYQAYAVTALILIINAVKSVCAGLGIMLNKRMLEKLSQDAKHMVFELVKDTSNKSNVFVYLTLAAALIIPVIVWVKSLRKDEPYDNPAQKRKIVKRHIVSRRWAVLAVIGIVLSFTSFTVLEPITTRVVSLSPVEEAQEKDGSICVSFEQVEDGHLHRFAYVSPSGIQIRFIVIKKPDSSSYGIGLDACDICGETGYYEKDGQVVCKLCDVVMNISTIGFKGGCNPIVIPYEIKDGEIKVPIDGLMEHEQIFKNNRMGKEV
ncbi:MAG: DUF2318 domain-containing protein [Ruminococcus sp.]|nr:DUF2318 domain-containing protein [Ruminococcus sp.]